MKFGPGAIGVILAAFLTLLGAAFSGDSLVAAHMWVFFFALAAGAGTTSAVGKGIDPYLEAVNGENNLDVAAHATCW